MTTIDFSPLFRTAIGFDRLANVLESAYRGEPTAYPPYNIELVEDNVAWLVLTLLFLAGVRRAASPASLDTVVQ